MRQLALVVCLLPCSAAVSAGLELQVHQTFMSAAGPEVHVLVTNHGRRAERFELKVEFVAVADTPACRLKMQPDAIPSFDRRPWLPRREWPDESIGYAESGSWVHRVFSFSPMFFELPCAVRLIFSGENFRKTQQLVVRGREEDAAPSASASPPKLHVETGVEREYALGTLLIRTLVKNDSPLRTRVARSAIALRCRNGIEAPASIIDAVPQGLDTGPAFLAGGDWVVFVTVLEGGAQIADKLAAGESCEIQQQFAYESAPGAFRELPRVTSPLPKLSVFDY